MVFSHSDDARADTCRLTGCDETNAVYALPGSHATLRRYGISSLLDAHGQGGGDVLPNAVPIVAAPGDVAVCFRNALHCSFPNASPRLRVTFNFGFHKRKWVEAKWGVAAVEQRRKVVPIAMDCRRQRYPHEKAFEFRAPHPFAGSGKDLPRWDGWNGEAGRLLALPRLSL